MNQLFYSKKGDQVARIESISEDGAMLLTYIDDLSMNEGGAPIAKQFLKAQGIDLPAALDFAEGILGAEWERYDGDKLFGRKPGEVPVKFVPQSVPLWAFRAALSIRELSSKCDAIIGELPNPDRFINFEFWNHGVTIARGSGLVELLGEKLALSEAERDDVFREASAVS